jgi:amino acid transporter
MTGWMYWASNLVYFPGLLYFTVGNALLIAGPRGAALQGSTSWYIGASLAALAIALVFNVVGLGVGKWLHNAGAVATWVPVMMLVGLGAAAWMHHGPATEFSAASLSPATGLRDIVFWSTIAFAFSGMEAASMLGGEIAAADRNLPRAILLSGVVIAGIYVLGTAAVLAALPRHEVTGLQGFGQAIERAGVAAGLPAAGWVAAVLLTISNLGASAPGSPPPPACHS